MYKKNNNRSVYLRRIKEASKNHSSNKEYQLAEAIVNLCYNYACEISIYNSSKHYDIREFTENKPSCTFKTDFINRLLSDLKFDDESRYLRDEDEAFQKLDIISEIPDFSYAIRMIGYSSEVKENDAMTSIFIKNDSKNYPCYETDLDDQIVEQKKTYKKAICRKSRMAIYCLMIAIIIELMLQCFQSIVDSFVNINLLLWAIFESIFFLLFSELITSTLSRKCPRLFVPLSDTLGNIKQNICDASVIRKKTNGSYTNASLSDSTTEVCNKSNPIDYIKSTEIINYLKFKNDKANNWAFKSSTEIPIADIEANERDSIMKLNRLEELYNYHFGMVYSSGYNTLLVDPIVMNGNSYKPYERIIPKKGNGVVIITIDDKSKKFILLKQFRHAPRKEQYSFPRGYAENNMLSKDNAKKELGEELEADIVEDPIYIGKISPDSGLCSTCAGVYLVSLRSYKKKAGYEGIKEIVLLSENEIRKMIKKNSNEFDDGFTLAALYLYFHIYNDKCKFKWIFNNFISDL